MTTKLTDDQRKAIEACAGQPVVVADDVTNKVYYLLDEAVFAHLRGLQQSHDDKCREQLRSLIEDGMRSGEIPSDEAFSNIICAAVKL